MLLRHAFNNGNFFIVHKSFLAMTECPRAALVLAYMCNKESYFMDNGMLVDGEWFYLTNEQLADDCYISPKVQRSVIALLETRGLIETKTMKIDAAPKRYIRLKPVIEEEIMRFDISRANRLVPKGQIEMCQRDKSTFIEKQIRIKTDSISDFSQKDLITLWNSHKNVKQCNGTPAQMAKLKTLLKRGINPDEIAQAMKNYATTKGMSNTWWQPNYDLIAFLTSYTTTAVGKDTAWKWFSPENWDQNAMVERGAKSTNSGKGLIQDLQESGREMTKEEQEHVQDLQEQMAEWDWK